MGRVQGATVVVGIPSFGMVSTYFLQSRLNQHFPLVSSATDKIVLNKPIADARNEIVEFALSQNAQYIYWLDDDVIAPPNAFLKLYSHQKDIINGVYWAKTHPSMPLLFRGHLEGPYWDWHVGDLIEIDAAGNGLTLVKTDVYRKISKEVGGPWYSVDYTSFPNASGNEIPVGNTEDLYFYWKAKKAGYKVWADTAVQALHYEKNSGILFGMPFNAPQANPAWEIKPAGDKLIADLGAGGNQLYMRDEGHVVTFDIREETNPSVVCDLRKIPVPDQTFDIVYSSHTLEHFSYAHVQTVLKEWVRILKVGGELRIVVPNLKHVGLRMLKDEMVISDMWVLYGEQDYPKNFHAGGFTPKMLLSLANSLGTLEDIEISEKEPFGTSEAANWSVQLRAIKKSHPLLDNISPEDNIAAPIDPGWWPIVTPMEITERPMTPESIEEDLEKAKLNQFPDTFDFFGPPERRIWTKETRITEPENKESKEEKDGLDSDNEGLPSTKRGRGRKTS
jgi:predicted SAM-dependent methyltransferase